MVFYFNDFVARQNHKPVDCYLSFHSFLLCGCLNLLRDTNFSLNDKCNRNSSSSYYNLQSLPLKALLCPLTQHNSEPRSHDQAFLLLLFFPPFLDSNVRAKIKTSLPHKEEHYPIYIDIHWMTIQFSYYMNEVFAITQF